MSFIESLDKVFEKLKPYIDKGMEMLNEKSMEVEKDIEKKNLQFEKLKNFHKNKSLQELKDLLKNSTGVEEIAIKSLIKEKLDNGGNEMAQKIYQYDSTGKVVVKSIASKVEVKYFEGGRGVKSIYTTKSFDEVIRILDNEFNSVYPKEISAFWVRCNLIF
ncbi:MAG: hypothetical protein RSD79_05780 [Cetobacterium sp.]